jgi:hypothetical protein
MSGEDAAQPRSQTAPGQLQPNHHTKQFFETVTYSFSLDDVTITSNEKNWLTFLTPHIA